MLWKWHFWTNTFDENVKMPPDWKGSQWARDSCRSSGASCSSRGTLRGRRYRLEAWNLNVNVWYNVGRSRPGINWYNVGGWTSGINVNYIKRVPCFFQIWQWLSNLRLLRCQFKFQKTTVTIKMMKTIVTYQWWKRLLPLIMMKTIITYQWCLRRPLHQDAPTYHRAVKQSAAKTMH